MKRFMDSDFGNMTATSGLMMGEIECSYCGSHGICFDGCVDGDIIPKEVKMYMKSVLAKKEEYFNAVAEECNSRFEDEWKDLAWSNLDCITVDVSGGRPVGFDMSFEKDSTSETFMGAEFNLSGDLDDLYFGD